MTAPRRQLPIAEGLFTWPAEQPALLGGRCDECGRTTFPQQPGCPACGSDAMTTIALPRSGRLWTWTIQGFPPKSPPYGRVESSQTFEPYGVGYIELPDHVRVEARLTVADPAGLRIGMAMTLVIVPFREDADGNQIMTYAFTPAAS